MAGRGVTPSCQFPFWDRFWANVRIIFASRVRSPSFTPRIENEAEHFCASFSEPLFSFAMRISALLFLTSVVLGANEFVFAGKVSANKTSKTDCVSFAEAAKHVGSSQCVVGTVMHVENGSNGTTFLTFCAEARACPFTVVVFPADRKKVGDIRQLEGRQIEIKGTIQDYEGRSEIVLRRTQQLGEGAFLLFPPVPTEYDVEKAGHSARGSTHAKKPKKKTTQQGAPISIEEPGEP